jgi:hypothetical protein
MKSMLGLLKKKYGETHDEKIKGLKLIDEAQKLSNQYN